jgi:hypothetical protein
LPYEQPVFLLAGWGSLGHRPSLPGIQREVTGISQLLQTSAEAKVWTALDMSLSQLIELFRETRPTVAHFSLSAARDDPDGGPQIAVQIENEWEWVHVSRFASFMEGAADRLRLIFLNGSETGNRFCYEMVSRLGVPCLGWFDQADDALAADFSLFFYERLLEGASLVDAIRAFESSQDFSGPASRPAIWLPHRAAVRMTLSEELAADTTVSTPTSNQSLKEDAASIATKQPGELKIELGLVAALNPALLKNGRPAIERLALDCRTSIRSVRIEVVADAGIGRSIVRQTAHLVTGLQPIPTDDWYFPILYQLIENRSDRRRINFIVTVLDGPNVVAEITRSVLWMGANEWMDQEDTWPFISAFVLPHSKAVLGVIGQADTRLKSGSDPLAFFEGYPTREDSTVVRTQIEAIFGTLRDQPYALHYISPPGGRIAWPGTRVAAGQRVRLADEVVDNKRGTCHDLVLLFAGCLEHIGLYPLILLIRGHTLLAYWTNSSKYEEFWTEQRRLSATSRARKSRETWTVRDYDTIAKLIDVGQIEVIEVTMVADPGVKFEAAMHEGAKRIRASGLSSFDVAVDVVASRPSVQPL